VTGLRWVAVGLSALQGGYMLLDGVRAMVVGSYITPASGEHAGQLGPWAGLVSAVGLQPESTLMKSAFVLLGALWLLLAAGIASGAGWAWPGGLALAAATLWYLVPGTVLSIAVLALLLTPALRAALGRQ
jgi:hypothetical protein